MEYLFYVFASRRSQLDEVAYLHDMGKGLTSLVWGYLDAC